MLRADSAQYHKLNGDTVLQLSPGDDLNLLPNGIAYTIDGGTTSSLLHIPPGITATSAVIITESGNGVPNLNAFRIQTMRIRHNNQIYVRFSGEPLDDGKESWHDFVKIPLCQPAQVFNLPLASGFTADGSATYSKSQESVVHLSGSVYKANGFAENDVIGTLPAGFRPASVLTRPAVLATTAIAAVLRIGTDGAISVINFSGTGKTYLKFDIQFPSAD